MSFAKRFGIAAAMEEINEQESTQETTPDVEGEVEIPVAEDTVETAVAEVETADSEVEQADTAIAEAEADVGALDTIADKITESEETGGLDASSAAVVEVAVEHLYQRLGVQRAKGMVAIESFGADSSRKKATSISAENIKETAQKVWDGILAMIEKAKQFIINFFKSVFTANGRIKERALKLKAALAKLEGKGNRSKDTIENAGFASKIAINGKLDSDAIVKTLGSLEIFDFVSNVVEISVKSSRDLGEQVKAYEEGEFKAKYYAPAATGLKETTAFGAAPEGFKTYQVEGYENIGGKSIVITAAPTEVTGEEALAAYKGTKVEIMDVEGSAEVKEAAVLNTTQMNAILDAVIKNCNDAETLKKTVASIDTAFKDIIADIKDVRNKRYKEQLKQKQGVVDKAKDLNSIRTITNSVISAIRAEMNIVSKLPSAVVRVNMGLAQGALEWVGQSAKLYSGDLPTIDADAGKDDKAAA